MNSKFLIAEWRKLAIANYSVDPKILLPYLPYKTELDVWNDTHYVSLVGFRFINTKLKGVTIPFHRNFEEINLRFYVRYKNASGWRRGVSFIREIVPKSALTFIANRIYKEKYVTMPTRHKWQVTHEYIKVAYSWKCNRVWNSFSLTADPNAIEILPNSKEEFITEHYWGYTLINDTICSEYDVEHPRWKTYHIKEYQIDVDFGSVYNSGFNFLTSQTPDSVMLAEGSEITVRSMQKIK